MRGFAVIVALGLVAGCADTSEREDTAETSASSDCPAWKLAVVEDGRIYCTDPDVLEREREIIESEEHW